MANVKVYIIVDKNGIEALEKLANTKYQQVVIKSWNNPAFTESTRQVYENIITFISILSCFRVSLGNMDALLEPL
jgi:hypothetical protein